MATPAFCLAAADCSAVVARLVSWRSGDGKVNDLADASNGALNGRVTVTASGVAGQCFSFEGTNDYVGIPDAPGRRAANLTIEAWVRSNSLASKLTGESA